MSLAGLLNHEEPHHVTLVLTDFQLPEGLETRLHEAVAGLSTRLVLVCAADDPSTLRVEIARAGLDPNRDYVSFLCLFCRHASFDAARAAFQAFPRADFARLELPSEEMGFSPTQAAYLLGVVLDADYELQDVAARRFYSMLGKQRPYVVQIETRGGLLVVEDEKPWFQLGGKLQPGENRILPGGEVAYTGSRVTGVFTVDGGLLATPQRPAAAELALSLTALSRHFAEDPVDITIEKGVCVSLRSAGPLAARIEALLGDPYYRNLTELGISFNTACEALVHEWAASSNEGVPGVHIGVGGDPDPEGERAGRPLVHVDLISSSPRVTVNGAIFMNRSHR